MEFAGGLPGRPKRTHLTSAIPRRLRSQADGIRVQPCAAVELRAHSTPAETDAIGIADPPAIAR
jgi:hypothetical protein